MGVYFRISHLLVFALVHYYLEVNADELLDSVILEKLRTMIKDPPPFYNYNTIDNNNFIKNPREENNQRGGRIASHRHERFRRSIEFQSEQGGLHGSNGAQFPPLFTQEVLLFRIAASGLPPKDPFGGKADPFVQIFYANGTSEGGSETPEFENFSRTKTLMDEHEPMWDDVIKFENYSRGTGQKWKFELRDHDSHDFDDHIGYAIVDIDNCVQESRWQRLPGPSACSSQITNENGVLYVKIL